MNYSNSQTIEHYKDWVKDEWVRARKLVHGGDLIVEHHIEAPDEIEVDKIDYHLIGYLLNNFGPRQITRLDGKEYDGENGRGDFGLNRPMFQVFGIGKVPMNVSCLQSNPLF